MPTRWAEVVAASAADSWSCSWHGIVRCDWWANVFPSITGACVRLPEPVGYLLAIVPWATSNAMISVVELIDVLALPNLLVGP